MTRINLLPWREQLREERKKQFLTNLGGSCLVAILIIALTHITIKGQITRQDARNAYLQSEIRLLDLQIIEIRDLRKQKAALMARMNIIQELEANRPRVVHIFDELVTILPNGIFLTGVTREGAKVILSGMAESNTNVSDLMRNIGRSKWLAKPVLSHIKTEQTKGQRISEFRLELIEKGHVLPGHEEG